MRLSALALLLVACTATSSPPTTPQRVEKPAPAGTPIGEITSDGKWIWYDGGAWCAARNYSPRGCEELQR